MANFSAGETPTAAKMNGLFQFFGVSTSITASPPSPSTSAGVLLQTGRNVVTTGTGSPNPVGFWTFNLPVAFPNGLVMFVAFDDSSNAANLITGDQANSNKTKLSGYAFLSNTAINGGGVDIGWIAIGW